MIFCYFFFFKQKTSYEMRISDWSSDVCSSDLALLKRLNVERPRIGIVVEPTARFLDQRLIDARRSVRLGKALIARHEAQLQLLALLVRLERKGRVIAQLLDDSVLLRRAEGPQVVIESRALVRRVDRIGVVRDRNIILAGIGI